MKKQTALLYLLSMLLNGAALVNAQGNFIAQKDNTFVYKQIINSAPRNNDLTKAIEDKIFTLYNGGHYSVYQQAVTDYAKTPAYSLTPKQLALEIKALDSRVANAIMQSQDFKEDKRKFTAIKTGNIFLTALTFITVAKLFRPATIKISNGVSAGLSKSGLISSSLTSAQIYSSAITTFAVEIGLASFAITPMQQYYTHFTSRYINYNKIKNMSIINKGRSAEVLEGYNNNSARTAQDTKKEFERDSWTDKVIQRNAIILLYALKYLDNYIMENRESFKYKFAAMQYYNLILPFAYKNANGTEVKAVAGRLFNQDQEKVIKNDLLEMENMKEQLDYLDYSGEDPLQCDGLQHSIVC